MNGIIVHLDPVAFAVGPVAIRWYGLAVMAAIIVGFTFALREARWRGLDEEKISTLALWAVASGLVGARVFHVIDYFDYYWANPWRIPAINEGGLSIYGALVGGLVAVALYGRYARLPLLRVLDMVAPGLVLAQAVGRIGNIFNGDVQGGPTDLPWGFIYTHPSSLAAEMGVPTHPYPVYEIIWNLVIFAVLWRLRTRLNVPGVLFFVYASLYSVGRFFLMSLRDQTIVAWGMQQAQIIALATLVVALVGMAYLLWRDRGPVGDEQKA